MATNVSYTFLHSIRLCVAQYVVFYAFSNYTYIIYHTAQLISYDCLVSSNVNKYFDPIINLSLVIFKYVIPRLMKN